MLKKLTKTLVISILLLYLLASAYLYFNQTSMVFQPKPVNKEFAKGFDDLKVEFENEGLKLRGWLQLVDSSKPFVFYYGGSGEEVSNKLHLFQSLGIHNYLLVNYRGYGDSEGSPSELVIKRDVLKQFDETVVRLNLKSDQIVLYGNSLGTGIATYVASQRTVDKVILNTPYDSVVNVGQERFPYMPVKLLSHQRFESIKLASDIKVPMLCIIAQFDQVIPPKHAQRLCSKWSGDVTEVTILKAGHNNIMSFEETRQVIRDYLVSQ